MAAAQLILASASPRRRQLLEQVGVLFQLRPVPIDESPHLDEPAIEYARRMAHNKAMALELTADECCLAADTIVHRGQRLFGKPGNKREAVAMLRQLSGLDHEVTTAFALRREGAFLDLRHVTTQVRFRALSGQDIERYVASGEPMDKAGAYGIQGLGGALVDRVHGSYTNVIGLPLPEVLACLKERGIP